jgi:4'-phosphopantetheinyl transferase
VTAPRKIPSTGPGPLETVGGEAFCFDDVAVRTVAVDDLPAAERLLELLPADERDRARGFAEVSDGMRFAGGRALLRSMLSERTGVDVRAWRFGNESKGKPFIEAPARCATGLAFSISHAGPAAACALGTAKAVGVDIEPFDRKIDVDRLAGRILCPVEREALASTPEGEARRRRMLEFWTLKEAVVKAGGQGVSSGLSGIEISFDENGPVLVSATKTLPPVSNWTLRQFRTATNCCGALAVCR